MGIKGAKGQQFSDIQFGTFGDMRDDHADTHMYQPPGSSKRFEIRREYAGYTARQLGKPDEILPGGRAQKTVAGIIGTYGGPERPEISDIAVKRNHQGLGLSEALLNLAHQRQPNLSHSPALSAEGARFASRNPLPNDSQATKDSQARHITADAVTAMLGGPRRRGYIG